MTNSVAFILKGYPRLSETFIAQEILALEGRGLDIRIISLRHPTDTDTHPVHRAIRAAVSYLPEYLWREPARVLRGWNKARRLPGYRLARRTWLADLKRDPTANRVRRFGQALVLANELPPDVCALHAHFLHTPASVTRYAAMLRGLDWSISAHAVDIWTSPDWEKREKLSDCRWAVTCSRTAIDNLRPLAPEGRVSLVYHGLDLERFAAPDIRADGRNGTDEAQPVNLLTVGRAVEKKGHDVLIEALALLPRDLHWRWTHIGGGPLLGKLKQLAEQKGVAERIDWRGSQPQERVIDAYRDADLFVLSNRIAANGDRDGLPNVLLEAQSQRLACVASNAAAVPELIEDGVNGRLSPPDDPAALSAILAELISHPETREAMGQAGRRIIEDRFGMEGGITRLAALFGLAG
jgi:glycosyltransferase involved in cell wall biosynthesis